MRLTLLLVLAGFLAGLALLQVDENHLRELIGYKTVALYRSQDTVWLGLSLAIGVVLYWSGGQFWLRRLVSRVTSLFSNGRMRISGPSMLAVVVLSFVGVGTYLIHHAYGLVYDEYLAALQAEIFQSGRLLADHPEEWTEFSRGLFPYFLFESAQHDLWGSGYRPVYAAIRAAFSVVSLGPLTNAVLTALSVVLVASVARTLWPDQRHAALLAAVLLATCPQFLFTGMTGYAWPAHLCLNLLWLRLFIRDDCLGHSLAALVGFAAVGLHQINPHPFFVLPFMISLLTARRWLLAGFYAATYSAALTVWVFWPDIALLLSVDQAATAGSAAVPGGQSTGVGYLADARDLIGLEQVVGLPFMAVNLARLLAWQNLAVLPLIVVALRPWSGAPRIVRLLAWSCVVSLIPYFLIMPNQMHAWGYRYVHGLLGNMALIASFGWICILAQGDAARASAKQIVVVFTVVVVVIGLPLRAVQVERFIGPMAATDRYLRSQPTDLVLVDTSRVWYRSVIIRNDPFLLDRPLVLSLPHITVDQVRRLCERYSVTFVAFEDLEPLGVLGFVPGSASGDSIRLHGEAVESAASLRRCPPAP